MADRSKPPAKSAGKGPVDEATDPVTASREQGEPVADASLADVDAAVIVDTSAPDTPTDSTPLPAATETPSTCVVKAAKHVGNAVPGTLVCSYHTMTHNADGSPRTDNVAKGFTTEGRSKDAPAIGDVVDQDPDWIVTAEHPGGYAPGSEPGKGKARDDQ